MERYDAIVVGARCAGATLALALARRGWQVLIVDRDTFPSETVSTHLVFPNTLARLARLGVLDRLRARHEVPWLDFRIVGLGHGSEGPFTPVDGFDRAIAPRRSALDACHFKHPGTAQGIGDAVEQALYVAEALPRLDGYGPWRDERALEHYDWSFAWGRFPRPEMEPLFRGWATEEDAGQDLRDSFSRRVPPSRVTTQERLARWFAPAG